MDALESLSSPMTKNMRPSRKLSGYAPELKIYRLIPIKNQQVYISIYRTFYKLSIKEIQ